MSFNKIRPKTKSGFSTYNAFDLVAGAVRTTKGKMIIPRDSTSVVSETIDVMPFESIDTMSPGKAFVYLNGAMNDVHKAHIPSERKAGRVSVLEDYQTILPSSEDVDAKPSASMVAAQKLLRVTSAQAPWAAADSLYRRTKKKEGEEKSTHDLVTQIGMKMNKSPNLIYGLIDSHKIP